MFCSFTAYSVCMCVSVCVLLCCLCLCLCLFTRCNVLISRFKHCSWLVKLKLFRSYCLCFYNIALWCSYNKTSLRRFVSSYNKMSSVSLVMPSIAVCLMSFYKLVCQLVTLSCLTVSSDFVKSYFLPVIS